jgi:GT2 family glycosyltransferase
MDDGRIGLAIATRDRRDALLATRRLQRRRLVVGARRAGACGRLLVGDDGRLDPTSAAIRRSPLTADGLPGPGVLGFVACGAVMRRSAYLAAGGFDARYGVGGEERRLALDLAAGGWALVYVDELVVHHHPQTGGGARPGRLRRQVRNDLWSAWLRRSLAGAPWVLHERRVVPPAVEAALRSVESAG